VRLAGCTVRLNAGWVGGGKEKKEIEGKKNANSKNGMGRICGMWLKKELELRRHEIKKVDQLHQGDWGKGVRLCGINRSKSK